MSLDISGWTPDKPGWTITATGATYAPGAIDEESTARVGTSQLKGPVTPIPANRIVTFSGRIRCANAESVKTQGRVFILAYDSLGRGVSIQPSEYTTDGEVSVNLNFFPSFVTYSYGYEAATIERVYGVEGTFSPVVFGDPAANVAPDAKERRAAAARETSSRVSVPSSQHALVRGDKVDKVWWNYFNAMSQNAVVKADVKEAAQAAAAAIPPTEFRFNGSATVEVTGNQSDGYVAALRRSTDAAPAALSKLANDEYGRITERQAATTDDLPEGIVNLYHTDERAQDAIGAAIALGTGDGATLNYNDAANSLGVTNTDKGSVAVAAHELLADPHPQYMTEPETTALIAASGGFPPTLIATGATFSVPANTQALFTLPIELEAGATLDVAGYLVEVN